MCEKVRMECSNSWIMKKEPRSGAVPGQATHKLCSFGLPPRARPRSLMVGKGRAQGGGSGGERSGSGRKKTKPGLTRKEKTLAKQACAASVAATIAGTPHEVLCTQLVSEALASKSCSVLQGRGRALVQQQAPSARIAAAKASALKASAAKAETVPADEGSKPGGTMHAFFKPLLA